MLAQILLLLVGRGLNLAEAACSASTCLNGGTCDYTYKGDGFRCNCPNSKSEFGPRCEIGTRSYWTMPDGLGDWYAVTTHDLSSHQFEADQLVITFELMAHCVRPPCDIAVVRGRDSKALVTVRLEKRTRQYRLWSPASGDHADVAKARTIPPTSNLAPGWGGFWQSMTIHMRTSDQRQLVTQIQLCSLTEYQCYEDNFTEKYDGDLKAAFKSSTITLGRSMKGCFRAPRVNGAMVDLSSKSMFDFEGEATLTKEHCIYDDGACTRLHLGDNSSICGSDSLCNGVLLETQSAGNPGNCTCRCVKAKRRERETIANNERCLISAPWNECTVETPIINTGASDYKVKWTTQDSGPIGVGVNFFSVEAMVKTREMNVPEMLSFINAKADALRTRIHNGLLDFCIGSGCYAFPQVAVADGEWHSVSVSVRKRELAVLVDKRAKLYTLDTAYEFLGVTVQLSIPNSCARSIRLSNIYMPTGGGDATADSQTQYIQVALSPSGAAAKPTCEAVVPQSGGFPNTRQACGCQEFEDCDRSSVGSGAPRCTCKKGFTRNAEGSCTSRAAAELLKSLESTSAQPVWGEGAEAILLCMALRASSFVIGSLLDA